MLRLGLGSPEHTWSYGLRCGIFSLSIHSGIVVLVLLDCDVVCWVLGYLGLCVPSVWVPGNVMGRIGRHIWAGYTALSDGTTKPWAVGVSD